MKVHIVWATPEGDRILDRLARNLAEWTGWSISPRPSTSADLNYSMCYIDLAQRFTDWRKVPWAAYFSHYEADTPYKAYWWELAEPITVVQTVTADVYKEMVHNPLKVTPFVEERFEIRERDKGSRYAKDGRVVIGFSGFVDRKSKRKGEWMAARLAEELEGEAVLVASGDGWPLRHVNRDFAGLVDFYNNLDLYVCTSTIEGIPMPPLEALKCGVPVVLPRGVGMMDQLTLDPSSRRERGICDPKGEGGEEGIWRYEAGNYEELLGLVRGLIEEEALKDVDREALHEAVSGYTVEAWGRSHVEGFERWAKGKRCEAVEEARQDEKIKVKSKGKDDFTYLATDQHGKRGVYYVAFGEPARKCALGAIDSFKKYLPDIPVALVSDRPLGEEDVFIEQPDVDIGGRAAKIMINKLAPKDWTYICYLDADTEIIASETFLWQVVEDGWDMVICKNPGRFHIASQMKRSDNGDECQATFQQIGTDQVMQLNGGVFCYQRNPDTEEFFEIWEREWRKYGKRDQAALLRALWQKPIKLYVVGNEWNTITRYDMANTAAWLLHYPMTARRWRGVVHYRLDDPQAWKVVDRFERERAK